MAETIEVPYEPVQGRTWRRTGNLRYAVPDRTTTDTHRLQEAWQCLETGEVEWQDIPTVTVPNLKPRPGMR